MIRRSLQLIRAVFVAAAASACVAASSSAQTTKASNATSGAIPDRAVRRNIPMTNIIRKAMAAGTRDSTGRPGRNYWQLFNDYKIDAKLDPSTDMLTGHERIVVRNTSPEPMTTIGMRLDQNIFRAHSYLASTWMPSEVTDGMVITKMTVDGQDAAINAGRGGRAGGGRAGGGRAGGAGASAPTGPVPVALNNATMTNATLTLPTPLAPGASTTIEVDWHFKLAGGQGSGHRMTARLADSLFQVTQWYPRVAVYDDLRGWDPEMYLGPSEFYNNFGRFDVTLDVPAGWVVGATGVLQNPQEVLTADQRAKLANVTQSDATTIIASPDAGPETAPGSSEGRLKWHFVADTVNDFAWGTSKSFVWAATRATIPGRGAIPVNIYYLPGHATGPQGYAGTDSIARHALEFYSKLWIPFPFPQMTIIDGPDLGMEYPMVVMASKSAADHEIGHSWWPMTVSGNETWYGWMDEGFNQYMNILSDADGHQRPASYDGRGQIYGRTSGDESEAPMMYNTNYGGPRYSFTTYQKTPLMLSMLGGIVGDSAVQRAQAQYAATWRFKHPSPWDYMFFMNNALHQDLGWFWYYWLFTTEAVQGSIKDVKTTGVTTAVTVHQDGEMPSPVVLRVEFADKGPAIKPMSNSRMETATSAIVTYPVNIWFSGRRDFTANLNFGGRRISKITLDPFGRFPDRDVTDNVWPRTGAALATPGR